jgi:uncharacterized protein YhfF
MVNSERAGHDPPTQLRPFELGFAGTDLRRRLVDAVLRHEKTATASLRVEYDPHTREPLPRVGERCILVGYADEPLGVVETTGVSVRAVVDVDLQFAIDEGEGFTSLADWRAAHLRFWAKREITDNTLIVCERFRLLSSHLATEGSPQVG